MRTGRGDASRVFLPMQELIDELGQPDLITKHESHRWKIGDSLFCVMPRPRGFYLFNHLDNKGRSRSGGSGRADFVIEAYYNAVRNVKRDEQTD